MNITTFRELIAAVEARPVERFDMGLWGDGGECGTVCCAFGSGVEANPHWGFTVEHAWSAIIDSQGQHWNGFRAASEVFDISFGDACKLFDRWKYPNPSKQAVLARLRQYLADHGEGKVES